MTGALFVTIGPPAAGKSTWAAGSGLRVVTLDDYKTDADGARVVAKARMRIGHHLKAGRSVVVDGCNMTPQLRSGWLGLSRRHGATATAVVFATPYDECLARNEARGDLAAPLWQMENYASRIGRVRSEMADEQWDDVIVVEPTTSRRW